MVQIISIILLLILVFVVYQNFILNKQLKKHRQDMHQLQQKYAGENLTSINTRLNPHLFKNILNSIQSHAYQTYYTIEKLSNVLDYVLYETQAKYVSVRDEMDFAKNLIEINKIKLSPLFDLRVKIKYDDTNPIVDKPLMGPLISIDLIENAFKHADIQNPESFISIVMELKGDHFSLAVSNKISVKPKLQKSKSGFGQDSLESRLQLLYPGRYMLEKHADEDIYFAQLKIDLNEKDH